MTLPVASTHGNLLMVLALARLEAPARMVAVSLPAPTMPYNQRPELLWVNAISNCLLALAYWLIFGCLVWIARRLARAEGLRDYAVPLLSLGLFIAAGGISRTMNVAVLWWPVYTLSTFIRIVCVAITIPAAILFARVTPLIAEKIPRILDLLSETRDELEEARNALLTSERIFAERIGVDASVTANYNLMSHILDSTHEGVLKINRDWNMVYANRRARELLRNLVLGQPFWSCFPGLEETVEGRSMQRGMEEGIPLELEVAYLPYDEWYRVNTYSTPSGISLFFTVISAEKKLERQLVLERAHALEQINSVMDSTSEGIIKLGENFTVLYGNRFAREMLPDLVIGSDYFDCFPAVRGSETETNILRAMADRVEAEWENFYEPYQEHYAVHVYPTPDGISIFFVPITTRKTLEKQLEDERMLREKRIEALSVMAGGLAHEISNPLAIIHGTASDLQRTVLSGAALNAEETLRASESIISTADRASRILRGLRGFAREAGSDPMEAASVYEIIELAVQMQEARFARHSIELRTQIAPGLPPVLCRETQVGQIVTNLMNNAFDAITQLDCRERWIRVEVSRTRDEIQIDVVDSGFGIDEDARKHLMEPFFTTKTRGLGMGVGLSLSRAIAREHGGSLELCPCSEAAPDTRFRLRLPLEPEAAGAALLVPIGVTNDNL